MLKSFILILLLAISVHATDFQPANSAQFVTALATAVGGDTISLTAGVTYTGPFTLRSGLTSTVTIRTLGASWTNGQRVTPAQRASQMAIIVCGTLNNQKCFDTSGNDADNWRLTGLDIRQASGIINQEAMIRIGNPSENVENETPNNIEIDHCWIESTQAGTVRGLLLNGRNLSIHDNVIKGFRTAGQENQAILIGGGPGPFVIDNNHLAAVGEVMMVGGFTVGIFPGDLTLTRNYLEAPQKYNPWNLAAFDTSDVQGSGTLPCSLSSSGATATCTNHGVPADTFRVIKLTSGPQTGEMKTVSRIDANTLRTYTAFTANQSGVSAAVYIPWTGAKNNFELKLLHGTANLIEGNVFDGSWVMGQDGKGLVLTVRTEDGALPLATIKNTSFQFNYFKRFHGFMRLISPDDGLPSGVAMSNVKLLHNVVELGYVNSGPGTQAGAPTSGTQYALYNGVSPTLSGSNIWMNHNTIRSTLQLNNYASWVGDCSPSCGPWTGFEIQNNLFAYQSDFGFFANGIEGTAALNARVGSGNWQAGGNTFLNHTTNGYPTGTFSESVVSGFGFNDVTNSDYKLTSGPYRAGQSRPATDGTDRGADITILTSKIGASSNAYATATIKAITGQWTSGATTISGKVTIGGSVTLP